MIHGATVIRTVKNTNSVLMANVKIIASESDVQDHVKKDNVFDLYLLIV